MLHMSGDACTVTFQTPWSFRMVVINKFAKAELYTESGVLISRQNKSHDSQITRFHENTPKHPQTTKSVA